MPYQIVKVGQVFKIKNLKTGRIGKLKYKKRADAQIQINNRLKYEKYINRRSSSS
tara:strand:- start:1239 stop:1403 length:165 start_codon:yes stop_codon:yes gene_type:complete